MAVLSAGAVVAGHRIESLVGRGGMGVVYEARQLSLDRVVALKVIAPELVEDPEIRARFLEEARAAASFEHPNVIPVYTAGEDAGVAYIAMRLVKGRDLRTLVRRDGPLAPQRAADVATQAGAALDAIHSAGFVHRDVKPGNLLVDPTGHIYLTDFGLVKRLLTRSGATRTGAWVGTLDYVAPEQIRGGRVDARVDVYALGGVLHYMLTGHVPFEHEGEEAKLWAQLREPPPVPSRRRPELPAELDAVVARAMAKAPDSRYPSAGDLGRAARAAVLGGSPSQPERMVARGAAAPGDAPLEPGIAAEARTRGVPGAAGIRRRRRPLLAVAGAVAVAGAAVAALLASGGGDSPRTAATSLKPAATATAPPPAAAAAATAARDPLRVLTTIHHVGLRPNHIVIAGADAWITSARRERVTRISLRGGHERSQHPLVGLGASDIAVDGNAVWVAAKDAGRVSRIDARTGRVTRSIAVAVPVRVAAGPSGLWVGVRPGDGQEAVLRYTRDGTSLRTRTVVPDGVGPMTLTPGGLWVAGPKTHRVYRVNAATGRPDRYMNGEVTAADLSFDGGYLWATQEEDDSLVRMKPRSGGLVKNQAGRGPAEVLAIGERVYVTSSTDNTLRVLDRETLEAVHPPLRMPFNPYGLAATDRELWITGLGDNTLTRVAYR